MGRPFRLSLFLRAAGYAEKRPVHTGADIRATVWEVEAALVQLSLRAGNRWTLLNTVDVKAKVLLAMIRLGIRVGAIPEKRYEPIAARLVEIGKIVGGLKKTGGERPCR